MAILPWRHLIRYDLQNYKDWATGHTLATNASLEITYRIRFLPYFFSIFNFTIIPPKSLKTNLY